jgi:hypothetical protein
MFNEAAPFAAFDSSVFHAEQPSLWPTTSIVSPHCPDPIAASPRRPIANDPSPRRPGARARPSRDAPVTGRDQFLKLALW